MHTKPDEKASKSWLHYSFWIMLLLVAAFTFLDYWTYSAGYHADPKTFEMLSTGQGNAPAQYRVAVIYLAKYLMRLAHGHLSFRHFFAAFDFLCALGACLLIRAVLLRTPAFQTASQISRYLRLAIVLGLITYYFSWALWYQRPETWACVLFVASSLYLISAVRSPGLLFFGLAALSVAQGFIRADVAILFNLGLFLYVLFRGTPGFLVDKKVLLAASCLGGILSTAILWLLMRKIFPHATYGDTKLFQLSENITPNQFIPFFLFFAPTLYTYMREKASGGVGRGQSQTLLLAAGFYLASWVVIGRLGEVRIFIPFAFALIPQTANTLASSMEFSVTD